MAIIHPSFNLVAHPGMVRFPNSLTTASTKGCRIRQVAASQTLLEEITADGIPRHDFMPDTGEYLGLLIERSLDAPPTGASTLITQAQSRSNGGFTVNSGTYTNNTSADLGISSGVYGGKLSASGSLTRTFSTNVANGHFTFSVYCKSTVPSSVITLTRSSSTAYSSVNTKTVNVTNSAWTRLYYTCQAGSSGLGTLTISIANNAAGEVLFDGFQLEAGDLSSFVATANRPDSHLAVLDANKINREQGTVFIKFRVSENDKYIPGSSNTLAYLGHSGQGTSTSNLLIQVNKGDSTSGTYPSYVSVGRFNTGSTISATAYMAQTSLSGNQVSRVHKIAVAYKESSPIKLAINGGNVITGSVNMASSNAIDGNMCRIGCSNSIAAKPLDGHLQHFAYFPRMLEDADLVSLTS